MIEEPVLKGSMGGSSRTLRIHKVHLLIGSTATEYEVWPEDQTREWLGSHGTTVLKFMVPPPLSTGSCSDTTKKKRGRKQKGEKKRWANSAETHQAPKNHPNRASSTPSQTPYRHHPDVESSLSMPQTAEEQKKGLRCKPQHMQEVIKASEISGKDGSNKEMRLLGGTEDSTKNLQQALRTASLRKARGTSTKQNPILATVQTLRKVQGDTAGKQPMSQIYCDNSGDLGVTGITNQSILDTTLLKKNKKVGKKAKGKAKKKAETRA